MQSVFMISVVILSIVNLNVVALYSRRAIAVYSGTIVTYGCKMFVFYLAFEATPVAGIKKRLFKF
jgi:hypothetical protein